ncbi:MAG: putative carbon monoxide dehydrogenase accessory protein [actinobacterium acAcidi]|nr:MAG: putative carbon monoxide dehydrogenase accessory protein [actinobacterium acAcidi]
MDLVHEFTVPVPVDDAWRILTDVERIAPCLPGAQLQEIEGDTYRGIVKVKVGPIQAQFKGQASFVEQDHVAHRVVLKGEGRDTTGKGNAAALITAELTSLNASSTSVKVLTDLSITGKVAQFGRGAMADISDKLLAQFVENLNTLIGEQQASPAPAAPAPAAAPTNDEDDAPQVRKIDAPEAEALDLLSVSSGAIVKRAIPVVIAIAAVVIWLVVR